MSDVAYYKRIIYCPMNYILIPGKEAYVQEIDPLMRNVSEETCKRFGIKRTRPKKNAYGQKMPDWDNYIKPRMSAAEALEKCYDPDSPICQLQCKKRCMEGLENPNINSIKRLKNRRRFT